MQPMAGCSGHCWLIGLSAPPVHVLVRAYMGGGKESKGTTPMTEANSRLASSDLGDGMADDAGQISVQITAQIDGLMSG